MLDRPTLIKRIEAGEKFDFLCYYGHSVPKDGTVGKTCFSLEDRHHDINLYSILS